MYCVGDTVLHIDRTGAARLYAGSILHGYSTRELMQRCQDQGMLSDSDERFSEQMYQLASSLSEKQLRYHCV